MKPNEFQPKPAIIPDTYELFWQAINAVEEEHDDESDILDIIEAIRETLHENQGREMKVANVRQYRVWFVFSEIGRRFAAQAEILEIARNWLNR